MNKRALFLSIGAAFMLLTAVLTFHTLQTPSHQLVSPPSFTQDPAPSAQMAERLSHAIQFATVSGEGSQKQVEFTKLHAFLAQAFPLTFQILKPERVNQSSLLIHVPGLAPEQPAALFLAHLDVVPVEKGTENLWQAPPFSGRIQAGHIWGRGAIDDKQSALALLEAIEAMLKAGIKPKRSIYLAFGHDEEIGGQQGAAAIAKTLQKRKLNCGFSLDEGLVIVPGNMIGMKPPIALIGISEKGYLSVDLSVAQAGGHASMPPAESNIQILAQALVRLQKNPFPARLSAAAQAMFAWLAPEMPGLSKVVLTNLWLFQPLLLKQLSAKPSTSALIHTTVAPTMLVGSPKENILPAQAKATLNLRLLPGDTQAQVLAKLRQKIADPRVKIDPHPGFSSEAAPESEIEGNEFQLLHQTIREVFPEARVAPSLVLAGTDSRHYQKLCKNQYRFQPVYLNTEDLNRIHGSNERIAITAHAQASRFYFKLMQNL